MNWIFIFSLLPCCPISTFTVSKISYFSYFPESIFPFLASFITTFTLFHQRGKDRFSQLFGKKIQTTLKFWDFLTRILHNHLHCQFVKTSGRIFWHLEQSYFVCLVFEALKSYGLELISFVLFSFKFSSRII